MSEYVKHIEEKEFEAATKSGVVLVDFHADWCGPCKMIAPLLEAVAKELQGKASIVKVDVDNAQQVASTYQVTSIPTLILFNHGKVVDRIVGARSAKEIKEFILKEVKD